MTFNNEESAAKAIDMYNGKSKASFMIRKLYQSFVLQEK